MWSWHNNDIDSMINTTGMNIFIARQGLPIDMIVI